MQKFTISRCLALLSITAATQIAASQVSCQLEQSGDTLTLRVMSEPHSLGGETKDMNVFRVRTLMAAPAEKSPWLLFEVYAKTDKNTNATKPDYRILTSQKVPAPFSTGRVEVVEPQLGRSLYYQCSAAQ